MLYRFHITGVAQVYYYDNQHLPQIDITIYSDTEQNALNKVKSVLGYPIAKHNRKIVVEEILEQDSVINTNEIKQQAYKEFAKKLKQHRRKVMGFDLNDEFWDYAILAEDIENTLTEMVDKIK